MPVPQLAEALYEAHRHRSTGCLNVIAEGRESQLRLDGGNLVGAEFRSGHRSLPQSLLRAGLIDPAKLDALWAEGQGAGPAAIEALGLQWTQACEVHTLSQIERLSEKATHVHFEAGKVSNAFTRIRGERVVRAAWLGVDQGGAEEWMFRRVDAQKCERWLLSEAERQFIRGFQSFKSAADATPAQRALLELLSREGAVERMRAPEPEATASEVSWAALLDDDPPVISIVPSEKRPPVVSNVSMDNRPPIVLNVPMDNRPPVVSIVPMDNRSQVVSIDRISNRPPALSIVSMDDRPPALLMVPMDDRPPVVSMVPMDNRPQLVSIDRIGNRPPALSMVPMDDRPPVVSIAPMDDRPPVVSIAPIDERPAVVSDERQPAVAVVPKDDRPPAASTAPIDRRPPAVPMVPIDGRPTVVSNAPMDNRPPVVSNVPMGNHRPAVPMVPIDDDHTPIVPIVPIVANGQTRPTILAEPKVEIPRAVWVEIAKRASPVEEIRAIEPAQPVQSGVKRNEPVTELEQALQRASAALADDGLRNQSVGGEVVIDEEISVAIGPLLGASADSETLSDNEENVADDPSNPEQAARARRQRLLRRAVENIGGLGARPADAPVAMESPAVEPAPAPPSPAAPSADEMELVTSLERKFHQIETQADCFALLGVPRTATDDEVKAAFLELAKVFHPDRLPTSLHHLLPKMRAVFESVREAYGTLQSESSRVIYEAGLGAEGPKQSSLNPAEEAAEAFKRGEVLFRKRDYPGAEFEYHRAYLLDSKANYLAAEAWAIHLNPERREKAPVAKQMMVEASKKDPNCDRAQYQLGVIARVEGDIDRAEKHFREAVRLNSKHLEARQELRLIEMRKKKGRSR